MDRLTKINFDRPPSRVADVFCVLSLFISVVALSTCVYYGIRTNGHEERVLAYEEEIQLLSNRLTSLEGLLLKQVRQGQGQ